MGMDMPNEIEQERCSRFTLRALDRLSHQMEGRMRTAEQAMLLNSVRDLMEEAFQEGQRSWEPEWQPETFS